MLIRNKIAAVFIVLLLVVSVFVMLVNPVEGAAVSDEDMAYDEYEDLTREYGWLHSVDIDGDESDPGDEPWDPPVIHIGQKDIEMTPRFQENITDDDDSDQVRITHHEVQTGNVERLDGDHEDWDSEDADWVDGEDNFIWEEDRITAPTEWDDFDWLGRAYFTEPFVFDVSNEATTGIYRIPIDMEIQNYSETTDEWYGPYDNIEYVWLELTGNTEVDDFELTPGMDFEQQDVRVRNIADQDLEDLYLTLDTENELVDGEGNEVIIHNPDDTSYVSEITEAMPNWEDFNFRFSVPFEMEPGEYEIHYAIEMTRSEDEEIIIEDGTITVTITEIVELSAEITENEVTQGTPKEEFTVTFTNTGNLPLEEIEIAPLGIDPFSIPAEYYEHTMATVDDPFINIGDLDVDESTEVEDIPLGLDRYMQIGQHKLFFEYNAYFYDVEGEVLGEGEGYFDVHDWDLVADTDEPFAWIDVTEPDTALDINAYDLDTVSVTDIGYQTVSVTLENLGYVEYMNSNIILHTAGTPFINPEDETLNTIEMQNEPFSLHGEDDREVRFGVIIDTDFIEERIAQDRPVYSAGFTMEAVNGDTLEDVEISFTAEGLVQGVGPRIVITSHTEDNNIEAGEEFELTFDIENRGDEPIRSLMVRASPHTTALDDYDAEQYEFLESGQDGIYFWQAGSPPGSAVWDVEPQDTTLYPGENTTVTFHMISSGDMQEGATYHIDLEVTGTAEESWETTTTIRTEESDSTKPILTTQMTYILVALILGIFFALGVYLYKRERKPKTGEKEEPEYEEETEEYTYEEPETDEIEPEPPEDSGWGEEESEEPSTPDEDIFGEEESQIEPDERDEW